MSGKTKIEGPLSSITVLDLTRVLAGPWCTRLLKDLGAKVIKVEPPGGDVTRTFGHRIRDPTSKTTSSTYFATVNNGKECICLDLKHVTDRKVFEQLMLRSDVLVENYRPGVMERLGFTWEWIHQKNPQLVYCRISGYGQSGPLSNLGALDTIIQAGSGILAATGHPGDGLGGNVRAGWQSLTSSRRLCSERHQAGIISRYKTKVGSMIDISMLDCSIASACVPLSQYGGSGKNPELLGNRNPVSAPFDVYQCRDGKQLVICAAKTKDWHLLCQVLKLYHLPGDPRFNTFTKRVKNQEALSVELTLGTLRYECDDLLEKLRKLKIPCGPINKASDIAVDPHVQARKMAVKTADGKFLVSGNPFKFSSFPDMVTNVRPSPSKLNGDETDILQFISQTPVKAKL